MFSKFYYLVICLTLVSCQEKDTAPLDACGNPTTETVVDKRCLYTVTTLTESFNGSGGLSVDNAGFIYVADFGNALNNADGTIISKIDPSTGEVNEFVNGLNGPSGNTIGKNGNLFQSNIRGQYVSEITPDGQVSLFSDRSLRSPVGVAFDKNDNLYVCNCGGASIRKIEPDGTSTQFSGDAKLKCPNGITIDSNDNLYVSNFNNSNVLKIAPDASVEVFATLPGSSNSHLVYGNNVIYALSRSGHKLYEITLNGEVSLIAGTGEPGNDDGSGELANFFVPNGIGLSKGGSKIYVVSGIVGQGSALNPVVVRVVQKK